MWRRLKNPVCPQAGSRAKAGLEAGLTQGGKRAQYGSRIIVSLTRIVEAGCGRGCADKVLRSILRFAESVPDDPAVTPARASLAIQTARKSMVGAAHRAHAAEIVDGSGSQTGASAAIWHCRHEQSRRERKLLCASQRASRVRHTWHAFSQYILCRHFLPGGTMFAVVRTIFVTVIAALLALHAGAAAGVGNPALCAPLNPLNPAVWSP